jgi:hypothetical protein
MKEKVSLYLRIIYHVESANLLEVLRIIFGFHGDDEGCLAIVKRILSK